MTTTDQTTRLPPLTYRPRRAPNPPRLAEADRPDPDELARVRAQLARSSRLNRFMRSR